MTKKTYSTKLCIAASLMLSWLPAACSKKDNGEKGEPARTPAARPDPEPERNTRAARGESPAGVRKRVLREVARLDGERQTMRSVGQVLRDMGPAAVPVLTGLLSDPDISRRRKASMALGLMAGKAAAAVPALLKALADRRPTPQPQWREDVVYALGRIAVRTQPVVKAVIAALGDKVAGVRRAAARVLGQMGPEAASAVPALVSRLTDSAWSVRKAAAQALGALGAHAKAALPALRKAGKADADPRVQKAALKAAGRIQGGK